MNSFNFIYSRRWLVILGLLVVLISTLVVLWVGFGREEVADEGQKQDAAQQEQSSKSSPTPTPQSNVNQNSTTWVRGVDVSRYPESSEEREIAETINQIGQALQSKDSQALHDLLSQEIKATFSEDSVEMAMRETSGLALRSEGEIVVKDNFAEQRVVGTDLNGQEQEFLVVLKKEDGSWKLYGTTSI